MDWRDVYRLPLTWDDYGGYVWAKGGALALDFGDEYEYDLLELIKKIVDKLNGDSTIKFDSKFTLRDFIDFYYKDKYLFSVRGWGRLTGTGSLNLTFNEAANIQNDFAKWILETLNS